MLAIFISCSSIFLAQSPATEAEPSTQVGVESGAATETKSNVEVEVEWEAEEVTVHEADPIELKMLHYDLGLFRNGIGFSERTPCASEVGSTTK